VGTLDKIIKENLEGEIFYDGWIKCKHVQRGLTHCKECLSVDNCWFYSLKKPKLPHHEKCHCHYETISFPTTKNCIAVCDIRKFREYIFGEKGRNEGKVEIFQMLGFTIEDSEYLAKEYARQALKSYVEGNYKLGKWDDKGQRITIDIFLEHNGKRYLKGSGWMVCENGKITNNTPIAKTINKELARKYKDENRRYS